MNLRKKRELAARTLGVGKEKLVFTRSRLEEIKEAITKQDIKDLVQEGAIRIKPPKGRRKTVKRKRRRGPGKIKKTVRNRKKGYVIITRKLRSYAKEMENQGLVSREQVREIRKNIRNRGFKTKAHLKEHIGGLNKQ